MNIENLISNVSDIIRDKFSDFCKNNQDRDLDVSLTEQFFGVTSQIRQLIFQEFCTEFYSQYEERSSTIEEGGKVYRFKTECKKRFVSPMGNFELYRRIYQQDKGGKCIVPLDKRWGMENDFCTIGAREIILLSSAHNTPNEIQRLLSKSSEIKISPKSIQREIDKCGVVLSENQDIINDAINKLETIPEDTEAIVSSIDGVNVLMREAGVSKGRPMERPIKERSGDTYAYRNAMCGSISFYRTVSGHSTDDIVSERIRSTYLAKMPQERYVDFKSEFEQKITQHTTSTSQTDIRKIMLCDGHKSLWNYIENEPLYTDFEFLVDFYHASEHLSKLAELLFGKSEVEAQNWYSKWREKLKTDYYATDGLIRSVKYHTKKNKFTENQHKSIKTEIGYFRNNQDKMRYSKYIEDGLPIGSGVVEAACKSIVKQRMCRSGMRWSVKGGEPIIKLRAIEKSNNWKNFWNVYKKCA